MLKGEGRAADGRKRFESYQPKRRKVLLSDKEQMEINRRLDSRLFSDCKPSPCKVIRSDDPEFQRLAAQITPVSRVRKGEIEVNVFCDSV